MIDRERRNKNRIGITWKMFAILILFVTGVVIITWFFQIQSIAYFYQMTRFTELDEFSEKISESVDGLDDNREDIENFASEHMIDLWIVEVVDGRGNIVMKVNGSGGGTNIPFISHKFETLYAQAKRNDGTYVAVAPYDHLKEDFSFEILADNSQNKNEYPIVMNASDDICAVHVTIHDFDGREYMAIQFSNITPFSAVLGTLRYQFMWSGILLGILALITAVIMARLITKPFVRMNEAAKRLAEGKYDADFSGKGYREINELADTLNYASYELSKNDSLQKELISNISHDLRTPLTMIKGYSEMMRDIPGENTPENVQVVIDETTRLSELVNDMLDLSKIRAGTRKPDHEIFSLTETVRETLQRYEKLMMQDGYRIEFFSDGDAEVNADKGMILQVVYNLINNAVNYTSEDRFVSVKQEIRDGRVRISVTDTGEGIAEADIPYIWDRYYKVDKVHKRATIGTGLGLSIVKGILEVHGASYGVDSVLNKGSTFWFELPLAIKESYKKNGAPEIIDTDYEENGDS